MKVHHCRDGAKDLDARPVMQQQQQQHLQEKADMTDAALSCTASKRCRQKVCPLGSTKILPELDMRWVWRKGRFPCFMLKQHTYSQASMFTVFIAALGLNRSQSHLEGSWVWGGLWVVIPTSVTVCVKMSACAEIQLGYKHS